MSIDLEYFRLFCSVATHRNVSKAAEELHLSQPTVTKELRKLEEQLGLTLFVQHSRGVKPTPEGEYLFKRIEPTSYNNIAAQHAFKNIIATFQEAHPNITIQSSIIPRSS